MSSFFDNFRFRIDENNLPVRAEQLRARLKLYPTMIASQMLVEPLFVWLMWGVSSHKHLLFWLAGAYLLHLVEFVQRLYSQNRTNTVAECRDWSVHFFFFALVIGMMWGFGTLFFFPSDLISQVLLISVMLGLASGATSMNATHPPSFYAYTFGLMLPLIFRVMVTMDETHIALGIMLLLFLAVMLATGNILSKLILLSLKQRFDNLSMANQLAAMNDALEHKVEERTAQLREKSEEVVRIRDVTIVAMGTLAETRDNETGNHLKRTQTYIRALAIKLRDHPKFKYFLTDENIEALYKLAPLHDVGKVGIPDHILLKPGKLTVEEFEIMKKHPALGGEVLATAESNLPTPSRFLHIGQEIATGHHEKWDGNGYPLGLKGDAIPVSARLMAVADVYDALISRRVYKEPFSHKEAVVQITKGLGTHFDPDVIDAFLAIQDEFRQIAEQYQD